VNGEDGCPKTIDDVPIDRRTFALFRGIRMITGGRANLRPVLYMNALIGMRYNPVLKTYYLPLR
jgi:hypothetical protein